MDSTRVGQRELRAYRSRCACTQRIEERRAELHARLDRVLVVDARFDWNGVGDSLDRWLSLLRLGLAAGRATFLWLSDEHMVSQAHPRLDLGEYFVADGADWQWSLGTRARVEQRMGQHAQPTVVEYACVQRSGLKCNRPRLQWASPVPGEAMAFECSHEDESAGALVRWLRARPEPWLLLRSRLQIAFEASGRAALAMLSGAFGSEAPCAVGKYIDGLGDRVVWNRTLSRSSLQCEAFAALRPRPWFVQTMLPQLQDLDQFSAVVALHCRTGFVDWAFWNSHRPNRQNDSWQLAAPDSEPASFSQQWLDFERLLEDCRSRRSGDETPCYDWKRPTEGRAPTMADVSWCRAEARRRRGHAEAVQPAWGPLDGMPGNGSLALAVTCAAEIARRVAAGQGSWGLFVLGDSPGFVSLVKALPGLHGRATSTTDASGALGHTTLGLRARQGGGATSDDPQGARTRSMSDFYLAGLADAAVTVLFSNFPAAILRRSILCGARTRLLAHVTRRFSRGRPMRHVASLRALMQTAQPAERGGWRVT